MDYDQLLSGCGEIGRCMLSSGAEIYRVEDTVHWILKSYGVKGDVWAIPTQLIVSLSDDAGRNYTRLYRTAPASIDIEAIEQFNALSRRICADPPPPEQLVDMARQTQARCRNYSLKFVLLGHLLGAFFFTLLFHGRLLESLVAALAGMAAGLCGRELDRIRTNFFFKTVASALVLGLIVYGLCALGLPINTGVAIIGALMVLIPGLVFTNFMSDLITAETLSGVTTFIRAILTVTALVIGTGVALYFFNALGLSTDGCANVADYGPPLQCILCFLACLGFCLMYNVHGWGTILCCIGGVLGWSVYLCVGAAAQSIYICSLFAAIAIAAYAEAMARLRKYPITAYLVVSYFPLVPGTRIYYAMYYSIHGDWQAALNSGTQAIGLAACLAMGTLLVSTTVRTVSAWRREKRLQKP